MNTPKIDIITTRDYVLGDRNFILATWLRGLYYGNDWFNCIDKETYFKVYEQAILALMDRPSIQIKIACIKEDLDNIVGYSVYDNNRLHWVHIKSAWRNLGIAKSLVPETVDTVSHLTKIGKTLLFKKGLKFNPFIN